MLLRQFMAMPAEDFYRFICIFCAIGGVGIYLGFRAFLKKRKIEDTACSKVSSVAQGLAEIQGQAWPTVELKSVEGRPVCYWHMKVQKYKRRGRSGNWVTVYEYQSIDPLLVMDGVAACLVVPEKAELDILEKTFYVHKMSQEQRDQLTKSVPWAAEYFSVAGQILGGIFGGTVRVLEQKILVGSPVYARGEFYSMQGSMCKAVGDYEGYRSQYAKVMSPGYQARMFDANRDGFISDEEYINGHAFAANAFARKESSHMVPLSGHLSWSEVHGLLLADTHQSYLLQRLNFLVLGSLWGGVVLLTLSLFLLFLRISH